MTDQRERVMRKYATLADREACCDPAATSAYRPFDVEGLSEAAFSASLGCGNPHLLVELRKGDRVLDLGSGAGLDVLVSARRVGPTGRAYGLDMTQEMLMKARQNAFDEGVANAEFLLGFIEQIPLADHPVDVVLSNCVIVLSTDNQKVFQESARVLRPGGRLAIADLIAPEESQGDREIRCDGSEIPITAGEYRKLIEAAGFVGISIMSADRADGGLLPSYIKAQLPFDASDEFKVRSMTPADWPIVDRIYEAGIATGHATFETSSPGWESWNAAHIADLRLVAVDATDEPRRLGGRLRCVRTMCL